MCGLGRRLRLWMTVFFGLAMLSSGPASAESDGESGGEAEAVVSAQRMGDHGDKTRFVLEFSRETDFSILTLSDPERIILDFPATDWRATAGGPGVGFIRRTEVGTSSDGKRRVFLTLSEPVAVADVFFIPARDGNPVRFVLDLVPAVDPHQENAGQENAGRENAGRDNGEAPDAPMSTPESNPESSARDGRSQRAGLPNGVPEFPRPRQRPVNPDGSGDRVAMLETVSAEGGSGQRRRLAAVSPVARGTPALDAVPQPPSRPSNNSAATSGAVDVAGVPFDVPIPPIRPDRPAVRTVVIDPGHGGIDPGAIGASGTQEKAIVLQAARLLRDALQDRGGYRVVLTRDGDDTLRLRDRVRIARQADGDLFLSIHADSMENERVRGASVYTLSEVASDREAEMLAARENRADALAGVVLDPNDDMVASILIDLAQRDTKNQSRMVADHLVSRIGAVSHMLSNSHRQAGFAVLTAPDVPSALIELGYLSNETDEQLLNDSEHLQTVTSTIAEAVDSYFATPNLVGLARR